MKTRIRRDAVRQYEEAVNGLSRDMKRKRTSRKAVMGRVYEDAVDTLVFMMRAARLNVPFCDESNAEIYFQIIVASEAQGTGFRLRAKDRGGNREIRTTAVSATCE